MSHEHDILELQRRIVTLEAIIVEKNDQIKELQRVLHPEPVWPPPEIKMTKPYKRLFCALHKAGGNIVTNDSLLYALYFDHIGDRPDDGVLNVFMHHMRRKLREFGLTICNVRGHGYFFDKASMYILDHWGQDPREEAHAA
jgi:DNA-binding response OmpR family regulator